MKIYIVEDDADIREMESYALTNSGFEVEEFSTAADLYPALKRERPALLLLDIMLPGEDGLQILRTLRERSETADLPVMMVTAKTTEMDTVRGLDTGADDYITKPFGVMEFVSRVKALLRRTASAGQSGAYAVGGVVLDDLAHTVSADGTPCELTYKEYELLKFLMLNKEIVLSREKIMDKVWGFDYEGESRTVDMHIKTLRQKLGDCGALIKTVRNVGYKISG
ncbi:MAG: winged helix-turn-helix domain-containing protein [Candidatus Howiella sp.]|jgi:two-component system alkaline phosphatase synthesis response regulator PhoP